MINGSCLCGTVRWRIEPPFAGMTHCHCSMCRKAHAAPFATYITVARGRYELLAGADIITYYESSAGLYRAFCGRCGSVVPSTEDGENVYVPAGCLDDDPGMRPSAHIFVASKAPWYTIADDLPQADTYIAAGAGPVIAQPDRRSGAPGILNGSCLCGGITYQVTAAFQFVYNCHCGRCRKARAAAYTTNGFVQPGGIEILGGENLLDHYKVPEAKFFTHAFCRVCGAGMPRTNTTRPLIVVPFGSLDDDPGRDADKHIYTGAKAHWYAIADDLPQFPERP